MIGKNRLVWSTLCFATFRLLTLDLQAAPAASAEYEASKFQAGLAQLGIGEGYEIVTADNCDVVEQTAAQALQRFLEKAAIPAAIVTESQSKGKKRFLLGRESGLKAIEELGDAGELRVRDISAEDDGFHLKQVGDDIVVAGANPRAVLYGVYAFEDFVNDGATATLDIRKVPYFRKRGSGLYYTYTLFGSELEAFPEEKAIYLSRLGINQLTDQGIGGPFGKFVGSDLFGFKTPPDPQFQSRVKEISAVCKKYGIDVYLFLIEPTLEAIDGAFDRYPEEALGTAKPPWGAGDSGLARTLCVHSPLAQDYLREMMQKLVREYPDVKGVQLYNLDVGSWFCTPELCERCKTACSASPPEVFNPAETQAKVVGLLADAAHAERPDFDLKLWSTVHYHGDLFDKMIHSAEAYDALASSWTGSDRAVIVPDAAERTVSCIVSQEVARAHGVPFYMMCELNNLEAIPRSLPFPFHVCDALRKYKRWDVENLTEIFGVVAEHDSINAIVTKAFQWNPDQPVEVFLADLARRQFGEDAGKLMYQAWEEMQKAFDVWDDVTGPPFPLNGSQNHVKMSTEVGQLAPPIIPSIVDYYDSMLDILTRVEPWLAEGYQYYKTKSFLAKMESMNAHFALAEGHARSAIAAASSDNFIGISYFEGEDGRPTSKQYAELNYAPIAIANLTCAQRCNIVSAYQLLTEMEKDRAIGNEEAALEKEKAYHELVREDIAVQEQFCALLTEFSKMQPCYVRTGLMEQEIANHLAFTRAKIGELKEFLADTVQVAGAADDSHQDLAMITKP